MQKLPDYLASGENARLIPVVSESNREHRLLSPVLAAMAIVPEFAKCILERLDFRAGSRTTTKALTEVVFKGVEKSHNRPDGLLVVDTGRQQFRVLIEAKTKNAELNDEQVTRYVELARDNGIDAVLTISNQFAATPSHSPVKVPARLLKRVKLYHISWSFIQTTLDLLLGDGAITDPDCILVMREVQRYLAHESSGISGFTQMNKEWREVVKSIAGGAKLRKSDEPVLATVKAWHQEQKDMCLILSRRLQTSVALKLPRRHADSSDEWEKATVEELLASNCLDTSIDVPDAAAPIKVRANLARKTITFSIRVKAPEDRKSTKARVNWLLRQLPNASDNRLQLRLHYPGSKPHQTHDLAALRENITVIDESGGVVANHLELRMFDDLGGRFSGTKTFIESLEANLTTFYDQAAVSIKQWQASAPKSVQKPPTDDVSDLSKTTIEPGDLH